MDAARKLITQLTRVTGLGDTSANTIANAVVDPAAVRHALTQPLPGLTVEAVPPC
ncbi:hypothetical protein ABT282_07660 [Streptomyces sp. NPDC000927]|uniref:hypothetical protein n=1 Tax=Streptomyces sp. NPDC000927 TaxID=3154371 RepID=UPI003317254B